MATLRIAERRRLGSFAPVVGCSREFGFTTSSVMRECADEAMVHLPFRMVSAMGPSATSLDDLAVTGSLIQHLRASADVCGTP